MGAGRPGGSADAAGHGGTADAEHEAFEHAVGALARRERTEGELRAFLTERGYAADVVDAVAGRLLEVGQLDDERFARRYAEDKRELRGWGGARIREALEARDVASDLIDAAVEATGGRAELERAARLLERRGEPLRDEPARARALAFLARRGYELELAYEAVRRVERGAA